MMLLWIIIGVFVVSLVPLITYWNRNDLPEWVYTVTWTTTIGSGLILIGMIFVLLFNYLGLSGSIADENQRYEMLLWQAKSNIYEENIEGLSRYSLMKDIIDWNSSLARKQAMAHDFWLGPFYPDTYEQLKLIDPEIIVR